MRFHWLSSEFRGPEIAPWGGPLSISLRACEQLLIAVFINNDPSKKYNFYTQPEETVLKTGAQPSPFAACGPPNAAKEFGMCL